MPILIQFECVSCLRTFWVSGKETIDADRCPFCGSSIRQRIGEKQ